jgi:uncharacterized repeat protein (TIGR03843 family)
MSTEDQAGLLLAGGIEVLGRLRNGSNETFLVEVASEDERHWAVYKPELGERPLHDFEPGLFRRERAAFLLSEALGWHLVPTTVIREDSPYGVGSLQWFVEHDPSEHFFTLVADAPETHEALRRMAVFDLVANNADRKAGHVLRGGSRIWGIDHGLCLAAPYKLRTVIWDFAGEPIDGALLADLAPLAEKVPPGVAELLDPSEVIALRRRARRLLADPVLPEDLTGTRFPWPLV